MAATSVRVLLVGNSLTSFFPFILRLLPFVVVFLTFLTGCSSFSSIVWECLLEETAGVVLEAGNLESDGGTPNVVSTSNVNGDFC